MARRRTSQAAFSLFSFQDIITSVTGIMILITLLLSLELINRVQSTPSQQTVEQQTLTQEVIDQLRQQLVSLENTAPATAEVDLKGLPSLDPDQLRRQAEAHEQQARELERQIAAAQTRAFEKAREAEAASTEAQSDAEAAREALEDVEKQLADVEARIAQVRSRERVFFRPGNPEVTTWLVEAKAESLTVARLGVSAPPTTYTLIHEFAAWSNGLSPQENDFLLLVRPGGENRAKKCEELLRQGAEGRGFQVGLQVVPEGRIVIDPQTGAGA